MLQQIKQSYQGTPADKAIRNAITNNDINKLAVNGESKNNLDTYFSNKVESKGISNQRSSGRCWLFTGLNVFRAQAIHKYDMGEFQFSQNYSFFWDQLEKANLFLQGIIDTRLKPMDDKMVEEAKFMQKMIKEGLFDSEAFTQTDSVAKEKHVNGSVALTGAHYSHIQNALEYTLYEDHPEMRYVPMGPIYDANGNPYMPETYTTMGLSATAVFVVPASTKKIDKIIKYLDYINTEEGRQLVYLGIDGEDWEYDENGVIRTTKEYKNNLKADGRYATDRGISSIYTYGVARLENNVYERANDVEGDPAVEYREIVREMYPLVRVDGVAATFWDDEFSRRDELLEVLITNDYKTMIESCYFANSAADIDNKVLAYRRAISKNGLMNDYLEFVKNRAAEARAEGTNVLF